MTKVVFGRLQDNRSRDIRGKDTSVETKRVRDETGTLVLLRTVDAASKTLSQDLTLVFGRNVERARKENKRITGSADFALTK